MMSVRMGERERESETHAVKYWDVKYKNVKTEKKRIDGVECEVRKKEIK